jgi:hypothetical protein
MQEVALDYIEMPALVGSGAEFIPAGDYLIEGDIIDLNAIPNEKTLIGYIFGGIESTQENIFFINDGTQSSASNVIFKVYINKSIVGLSETTIGQKEVYSEQIFPNPATDKVTVQYYVPVHSEVTIEVLDINGKLAKKIKPETLEEGNYNTELNIADLPEGSYVIRLFNGKYHTHYKFIKK